MTTILYAVFIILISLILFTVFSARRVEKSMPPLGRIVDTPHARFHVYEKGSGPCILLIHGLGGQMWHFNCGIIDQLAKSYRVIAIDRPGSGYSTRKPNTSASLNSQADYIAELMQKLDMRRTTVAGHSLGGAIALALAQRHPKHVAALALIAPLTHAPTTNPGIFKPLEIPQPWLRHFIAWTLALPISIIHQKRNLAALFGPEAVPEYFETRAGALLGVRPSHFIATSTDMVAAPLDLASILKNYPKMTLPISILYGRGDKILSPEEHGVALQKSVPNAKLTLVDGGHMLPITIPEVTASFIQKTAEQLV